MPNKAKSIKRTQQKIPKDQDFAINKSGANRYTNSPKVQSKETS